MNAPPPPQEIHPAYAAHAAVLTDWLNGHGEYAGRDRLMIPRRPARVGFPRPGELYPTEVRTPHVLTRYQAWGRAPYVGRPFVYAWWVARDELGRAVAGDARIVYHDQWG